MDGWVSGWGGGEGVWGTQAPTHDHSTNVYTRWEKLIIINMDGWVSEHTYANP